MPSLKLITSSIIFSFVYFLTSAQYVAPVEIYSAGKTYTPISLIAQDFNGDDIPDIISQDLYSLELFSFINDGSGQCTLIDSIYQDATVDIVSDNDYFYWQTSDFNADGHADLYFINEDEVVVWLKNNGNGEFVEGNPISNGPYKYQAQLQLTLTTMAGKI